MAMDAHLITNLFNHTLEPSPEVRAQAEKQLAQVCKNMCLCVYTCVLVHVAVYVFFSFGATPQAKVTQV